MPGQTNQIDMTNLVSPELKVELEGNECQGCPEPGHTLRVTGPECKWRGNCYYCKGPDGEWYLQYCL